MQVLRTLSLSALVLTSLNSQAFELNDEFSLNLTPAIVSDYRASGLSQTQNDPAAQFDLMLSHASGLYAGIWTSTVDYGLGIDTRQEIDY